VEEGMAGVRIAVQAGGLDDPRMTVDSLAAEGVEAIEANAEFFLNNSAGMITETARILDAGGVKIRSVHAPFGNQHSLSAPDEDVRAKAVETHAHLLRQTAYAGVSVIIAHPGTSEAPDRVAEMREWCTESLIELAPIAEQTQVHIGLENMLPNHPGTTGEELLDILDVVDSPAIGVCFDTGHAHCNGDMRGVFEVVKDRIITFHLADNDGVGDLHFQPPYGTINWIDFVSIFRTMELPYRDFMTVEAPPWPGSSYRQLIDQVSALLNNLEARLAQQEKAAQTT
jgi:sugar phosphate isomerase/epimerase